MYAGSDGDNYAEIVIQQASDSARNPLTIYRGRATDSNNAIFNLTPTGNVVAAGSIVTNSFIQSSRFADNNYNVYLAGQLQDGSEHSLLTIGPDGVTSSITPDGSASFTGNVEANMFTVNWPGATGTGTGAAVSESLNVKAAPAGFGLVVRDNTASGTPTATISGNGSAEFAGDVQSGGNPYTTSPAVGTRLDSSQGGVVCAGTNVLWTGKRTDTGATTSEISADGSAEFANGNIRFYTDETGGVVNANRTTGNGDRAVFFGSLNDNDTSVIYADGTAAFAAGVSNQNAVTIGAVSSNVGNQPLINMQVNGSSDAPAFKVQDVVGSKGDAAIIYTNGSATFTGNINTNSYLQFDRFQDEGVVIYLGAVDSLGAKHSLVAYGPSGITSSIGIDGTASFAGAVSAAGLSSNAKITSVRVSADQNVWTGYQASIASPTSSISASGNAGFSGVVNAQSGLTIAGGQSSLNPDGSAVFNGTVSAQGSVLTSDQRFKTDVEKAHPQLEDVVALGFKLSNWTWTEDAPVADKDTRFLGLIAQEVEKVCPGLVTTIERTKQGEELTPEQVIPAVYKRQKNEEGKYEKVLVEEEQVIPATYEEVDDSYQAIKSDVLVMKLLGAVAELAQQNDELRARLDAAGL